MIELFEYCVQNKKVATVVSMLRFKIQSYHAVLWNRMENSFLVKKAKEQDCFFFVTLDCVTQAAKTNIIQLTLIHGLYSINSININRYHSLALPLFGISFVVNSFIVYHDFRGNRDSS